VASRTGRSGLTHQRWLSLLGVLAVVACASTPKKPAGLQPPEGPAVEVDTVEGVVRGVTDGDVHAFLGVPYGAPVDGLNRWLPPQPPAKRDGVFDAGRYGPACEQVTATLPGWMLSEAGKIFVDEMADMEGINAEEKAGDCLRLNIWTPSLPDPSAATPTPQPAADDEVAVAEPSADAGPDPEEPLSAATRDGGTPAPAAHTDTARGDGGVIVTPEAVASVAEPAPAPAPTEEVSTGLPVMVFLHGGSMAMGSGRNKSIEGAALARRGAVVITINFRLGPIGFLAADGLFDGDVLKGNRGMMDTIQALTWVRDNIASFGGDPNRVTLAGMSGGGTNVWTVLASPASDGLVHRAILQSAPVIDVSLEDHTKLTKAVLKDWGVAPGDEDALANVKGEDAYSTIMQTKVVGTDEYGALSRTLIPYTGAYGTEFLPDDIMTAINKGRLNKLDLLVGSNADDAKVSIIAVPLPDGIAIDMWNGYIGGLIAETKEGEKEMVERYKAAMPDEDDLTVKEQLQTDALYRIRALKAADRHSELTTADDQGRTYAYQFNWESPAADGKIGAMHQLDVVFLFGNLSVFPRTLGHDGVNIDPTTQRLSDQMGEAWVSFAATGKPTSDKLPEWPEYETGARETMVFDKESKVVSDPGGELRKLWE
jgi:carboxylesterase type B